MRQYNECFEGVERVRNILERFKYKVTVSSIETNTADRDIIEEYGPLVYRYEAKQKGQVAVVDIRQIASTYADRLQHYFIIVNGDDNEFVLRTVEILETIHNDEYSYGGRSKNTRRAKKTRRTRKTRRT
jgi:hypothetical protein